MSQFFIRLLNFFANEVITKRLANSRAFQRFALRTHDKVQAAKGIAQDPAQARQLFKEAEKAMREGLNSPPKSSSKTGAQADSVSSQFERFKQALKEEVRRDLGSENKGRRK